MSNYLWFDNCKTLKIVLVDNFKSKSSYFDRWVSGCKITWFKGLLLPVARLKCNKRKTIQKSEAQL